MRVFDGWSRRAHTSVRRVVHWMAGQLPSSRRSRKSLCKVMSIPMWVKMGSERAYVHVYFAGKEGARRRV